MVTVNNMMTLREARGKKTMAENKPFTAAECAIFLELAEQNLEIIKSKSSSTLSNQKKMRAREEITAGKSQLVGVCLRTVQEVKDTEMPRDD